MSDARALLRAKRQEARISHPLASYNAAGQLRCIICGTLVKFASAWEGHLGSKAHRTNVARVKEEERRRDEARAKEEAEEEQQRKEEQLQAAGHKRKAADDDDEDSDSTSTSKKQKLDANTAFPTDFFSDPSRAPVAARDSDDEDEEETREPAVPAQPPSAIDLEYERFQKEFLQAPDFQETYERATVMAEPELAPEVPEGFPEGTGGAPASEGKPELTEEEKREQKETEEKELIMDRLLEEERAQEEADMKVQMMKNRLEAFKKQREAARAAKAAKKAS
ncbi:hypothetical protein P691DRAFT_34829 [Macrolepiota fuliginosa MF-IS2]|uniref:Coiled-coil domain-containing protein 16 n=1 Tax=Macrolepiota fuliginosa MF-IS2 TaxID=1400762 RepID=A0A9P5XCT2_9AGAR|nr:hypothetical protein P691DRAFT_34829 [Macrolepiota fuliginosa MF-IS2]